MKDGFMKNGFTRAENWSHCAANIDFIGYMVDLWAERTEEKIKALQDEIDNIKNEASRDIKTLHDMLDRAKREASDLAAEERREEEEKEDPNPDPDVHEIAKRFVKEARTEAGTALRKREREQGAEDLKWWGSRAGKGPGLHQEAGGGTARGLIFDEKYKNDLLYDIIVAYKKKES